jgi:DNA recombination protein RmuC
LYRFLRRPIRAIERIMNAVDLILGALALVGLAGMAAALWALGKARSRAEVAEALLAGAQAAPELVRDQAKAAAQAVADQMVVRATETFKSQELLAQQRMEAQLKPVADTLLKFQEQVVAMGKERAEDVGNLKAQIGALLQASVDTQAEARKLSGALRRGAGVQGRWGEQILENVLAASGLNNRYAVEFQASTDTEDGPKRPDAKILLPGGSFLVVDAKCSLTAFDDAMNATDDVARIEAFRQHGQSVRRHMMGLSGKAYWDQFKGEKSPDLVAMFLPGDGYLAAALEHQPDLITEGWDKRVALVTPTTLFALCKAVAYGWRVEEQSENAEKIAVLGRELYKRLSVMGGHAAAMGKSLEAAVSRYNQFVGSLETQVLTQARRFEDLAVDHEGKELPVLEPIETAPRALAKLATPEAVGEPEPSDDAPVLTVARG